VARLFAEPAERDMSAMGENVIDFSRENAARKRRE
jgi:hypothetical protein